MRHSDGVKNPPNEKLGGKLGIVLLVCGLILIVVGVLQASRNWADDTGLAIGGVVLAVCGLGNVVIVAIERYRLRQR